MTKTISIRDEVYRELSKIKREGKSLSELFERLVEGKDPLDTLKEPGGRVEFEDKERMLSKIYDGRVARRP